MIMPSIISYYSRCTSVSSLSYLYYVFKKRAFLTEIYLYSKNRSIKWVKKDKKNFMTKKFKLKNEKIKRYFSNISQLNYILQNPFRVESFKRKSFIQTMFCKVSNCSNTATE